MEVVALIRRVFLRLVSKMCNRFLEERIYITFCVKLCKNASGTYALHSKAYRGETVRTANTSIFELHKRFKESSYVEVTNEDITSHFLWYQGCHSL
jgi:hypothetical protein